MNLNWNAVKAGVGLFLVFGFSLGVLIFLIVSSADIDDDFSFEMIAGVFGFIVSMIVSPILATIVGAIISKDFSEESDAAFNGAISGLVGTFVMVVTATLFLVAAMVVIDEDSDSTDIDDSDDSSDFSDGDSEEDFGDFLSFAVKSLLPSGVGGAMGAFAGFRFLWSKMPSSEMMSSQPVVAQPVVFESVTIACHNCNFQMVIQKLGKLQKFNCKNCSTICKIEI